MARVAVIGGGISGIAAALECTLHKECAEVHLYESSSRLGGVIETVRDSGYLIERAADNFATLIPDALKLTEQFGDVSQLIHPAEDNRQAFVLSRGVLEPIPLGFSLMQPTRLLSIAATRTLSIAGKLRVLREFLVAGRDSDEDESLESFACRRLGREAFESLVEPIVSGIFTADPSTLSMQATMPQFVKMEREHGGLIRAHLEARKSDAVAAAKKASGARYNQFLAPKAGMSDWIDTLASKLPTGCVRLKAPVEKLSRDSNSHWQLDTRDSATGISNTQRYDKVVLATPASVTSKLLQNVDAEAATLVGSVEYASSVVVAVVVRRSEILGRIDGFGAIVPKKEGRAALAISYSSNKYPGRVGEDEVLLRVFFGGATRKDLVERDDKELIQLTYRELHDILHWKGTEPRWQAVIRWNNAMPQYLVGHVQRMQQVQSRLSGYPSLKLCGAAYGGVGIPQCVRSGRNAVRELFQDA